MQLLPRHMEKHFQRNYQREALVEGLGDKVQRLGECFKGGTLPPPNAKVITAWKNVPNATTNILPMSLKTEFVAPQAPPPTPTGLVFGMDDATSSKLSLSGNGWVLAEDIDAPSPDAVACRPSGSSGASDGLMSLCDHDQLPGEQNTEEDLLQCNSTSPSSSSGYESVSSDRRTLSTPVGFHNMVSQWFLDYRVRGAESFVDSLIAFGVVSLGTAPLASRIARAVIRRVSRMSRMEGKNLENTLRFSALSLFKKCWETGHNWMASPTPHGVGIASMMGSLFDEKISTARDIHLCLSYLLKGEKRFDRLCAIRALLVQANDKLCKSRNFQALMEFRQGITSRDEKSGEYLWTTTPHSKAILIDILATIERWTVSQAIRREQSRRCAGNGTVRSRAVGPRLRVAV